MTSRAIIAAISVGCLFASAFMFVRILMRSSRQHWHRHLDRGSLAFGTFMVLFGVFEYHIGRLNEQTHRVHYNRGALITPTQDYLAAFGFAALGLATSIIAIVHGRADSDQSRNT